MSISQLLLLFPAGQELVVAIADFALETVLVFFASNKLSTSTFLSLANKNTIVQTELKVQQHKYNNKVAVKNKYQSK